METLAEAQLENPRETNKVDSPCAQTSHPRRIANEPSVSFLPYCGAKPKRDCDSVTDAVGLVHLSRIAAAAAMDALELDKRNEKRKNTGKAPGKRLLQPGSENRAGTQAKPRRGN